MERVYKLESASILQLSATTPLAADASQEDRLTQWILRENPGRLNGDFLEIGGSETSLAAAARVSGKRFWAIPANATERTLPEPVRLAFAFVNAGRDPVTLTSNFRLVWGRLVAGGWAGFVGYAGELPEITSTLNSLLTEHSAEIDRVARIKEKWVLLIRKGGLRTEWKKL